MDSRHGLQECFFSRLGRGACGSAGVGDESQETDRTEQADQEVILGQHLTDRYPVVPLDPGDSKADKTDRDKRDALNPLCAPTPGP